MGTVAPGAVPAGFQPTGLASLDIELPQRGVEFLFTTPRGNIEITARSIATPHYQRMLHFLLIVAVLVAATILCQIGLYWNARTGRTLKCLCLVGLGFLSMVLGILAIAGLIAFLVGLVLLLAPLARSLFLRILQAAGFATT